MLSAQDVHDKQFKLVRQSTGYDIDEVDAFLDEVEGAIAELTAALDAARAAVATGTPEESEASGGSAGPEGEPAAGAPSPGPSEQPTSAATILELAQRTADQYLSEARRTADGLLADAQQAAQAAVAELESQRVDLEARVAALRSFEAQVRTRLSGYFEGQLRDLRALGAPQEGGSSAG